MADRHRQKWRCHRSGDCCLNIDLVMTIPEAAAFQAAMPADTGALFDTSRASEGWIRLTRDGACPALVREADGTATCGIWESRPFQCRRFICGRDDPATEPYEAGGPMGCRNLSDRVTRSLDFAEFYAANQRRAQTWALAHGWRKDA